VSGEGREHHGAILREVAGLIERGAVRSHIAPLAFDLVRVGEAHEAMASRKVKGKLARSM
jgi:NADPH:quinone reductase-like Zn-dependent oxidoreductase